jgi:hypothetical protein
MKGVSCRALVITSCCLAVPRPRFPWRSFLHFALNSTHRMHPDLGELFLLMIGFANRKDAFLMMAVP